ncbi:MAG: helix-turn-helix domain-containing protein [Christensenellales bacterium]
MKNMFDISDFVNVPTIQSTLTALTERVKTRRKELKLSQKLLAQKSGVSYASVRRFESTGDIALVSLLKIASALSCLEDFNALFSNKIITNLKDLKV